MAEPQNPQRKRYNRDPTYDLSCHIVTGQAGPLSGEPTIQQYDMELDRNDPMDDWTRPASIDSRTVPNPYEEIERINIAGSQGLQIGQGNLDQTAMDRSFSNRSTPNPGEGGLNYGPNNTGNDGYRGED